MPIIPFAEFKQHANRCRLLAFLTTNTEHKATLEDMARVWEKLAKERERDLAEQMVAKI